MKFLVHRSLVVLGVLSLLRLGHTYSSVAQPSALLWPDEWQADPAFMSTWARTDGPVASRSAGRSWVWGPLPFAVANEEYRESATGTRLVTYLDKGRMEVNDPLADRDSPWFVRSGLLVSEMVEGRVQVGDSAWETKERAYVPVAGDPGSPGAPHYSSFAHHTAPVARAFGSRPEQFIAQDGSLSPLRAHLPSNVLDASRNVHYDDITGHNIPAVFSNLGS